mmetsp:Transcript_26795/g.39642  ORF Transcript_26795/g.39642 Transcript_26795/m.39642 type:complete len:335 (-) Transcript_26795:178-1182(-)
MKLLLLLTSLLAVVIQAFAFSSWQRPPTVSLRTKARTVVPSRRANLSHLRSASADSEFSEAFQYNLRKSRLTAAYKAAAISYALYALHNLRAQSSLAYACLFASGHGMAAGLACILNFAAVEDRLFLFTSKRYNLALMEYGVCQLVATALAGRVPRGGFILLAGPLFATISTFQGYIFGVRGWTYQKPVGAIVGDLKKGTSQTLSSLFKVPKNIKSFGYLGGTLLVAAMKLEKLKEIGEVLVAKSDVRTALLVPLAGFGRLALFTSVVYNLKDGADRGILDNINFIGLNLLSAFSFAALVSHVGTNTPVGGFSAFFSVFCALNGVISFFKSNNE